MPADAAEHGALDLLVVDLALEQGEPCRDGSRDGRTLHAAEMRGDVASVVEAQSGCGHLGGGADGARVDDPRDEDIGAKSVRMHQVGREDALVA